MNLEPKMRAPLLDPVGIDTQGVWGGVLVLFLFRDSQHLAETNWVTTAGAGYRNGEKYVVVALRKL
ncbi:MAG: hypothetical protein MN733_32565 [Nitrososphaera sp.]|nr:hypothetical protein [Nitrososphaera sp.]